MSVRLIRVAAVGLAAVMLVSSCSGPATSLTPLPAASTTAGLPPPPIPMSSPVPTSTVSVLSCARRVLAGMSLAQRIGQLFLMGLTDDRLGAAELDAIEQQHVGSVWFTAGTSVGVAGVRQIADGVQAEATARATAGVGFFVAANQEGGLIQALRGPGFPAVPSGAAQGGLSLQALETDAQGWGLSLRAAGVNVDFAPVFDVVPPGTDATNQPIGVLQREYGHDPATAGTHAAAFMRGLARAGVATTAKHFPGLGRVVGNTDVAAGVVDGVTTGADPYLGSFRIGIAAGVPFVMIALATYPRIDPDHLAAFSPLVIGGLLRRSLGFSGVVMSDDLGATAAVAAIPAGRRAVDFLLAGGDFMVSKTAEATVAMVAAVAARAAADLVFASRVDDAALRILAAKQATGLLPCSG